MAFQPTRVKYGAMTAQSTLTFARRFLAALVAVGLAAGLVARGAGLGAWSNPIWTAVTVPVLAALLIEIVTTLRRGDVGLDIVAALSMSAALVFGESLAAAIVALMYSGGQFLEAYAERARPARDDGAAVAGAAHRDAAP